MPSTDDSVREIARLEQISIPRNQSRIINSKDKLVSQEDAFPVHAGNSIIRRGTLIRPNVEKNYSAGSVISGETSVTTEYSNISTRSNVALSSGIIIGGKLCKTGILSQDVWFRLWIFLAFPGPFTKTPAEFDGTPYQLAWARRDKRVGYLDFNQFISGVDCAESPAFVSVGQNLLFELEQSSLYGVLETKSAYTSPPNETFCTYLYVSSD